MYVSVAIIFLVLFIGATDAGPTRRLKVKHRKAFDLMHPSSTSRISKHHRKADKPFLIPLLPPNTRKSDAIYFTNVFWVIVLPGLVIVVLAWYAIKWSYEAIEPPDELHHPLMAGQYASYGSYSGHFNTGGSDGYRFPGGNSANAYIYSRNGSTNNLAGTKFPRSHSGTGSNVYAHYNGISQADGTDTGSGLSFSRVPEGSSTAGLQPLSSNPFYLDRNLSASAASLASVDRGDVHYSTTYGGDRDSFVSAGAGGSGSNSNRRRAGGSSAANSSLSRASSSGGSRGHNFSNHQNSNSYQHEDVYASDGSPLLDDEPPQTTGYVELVGHTPPQGAAAAAAAAGGSSSTSS